tara:strand:+ start:3248 stop:3736 length:489 start_codon:yes stop_codon:yes gene_type:complete
MERQQLKLLESDELAVAIRKYKSAPSPMTLNRLVRVYQRSGMVKEAGKLVGPVMTKWSGTVSRFADEIQAAQPSRTKRQGATPARETARLVREAASELREYGKSLKWGDEELDYALQEVHRAIKKAVENVRSPRGPKLGKKDKDRISDGLAGIEKEVKLLRA